MERASRQARVSVQAELCSRVFTLYPKISVISSYTAAFIAKMFCLLSYRITFCVRQSSTAGVVGNVNQGVVEK